MALSAIVAQTLIYYIAIKLQTKMANLPCKSIAQRHEYIVKFYNRVALANVATVEEIPQESLVFLCRLSYKSLVEPFVKDYILEGKSMDRIARITGLTKHQVRGIGTRALMYAK